MFLRKFETEGSRQRTFSRTRDQRVRHPSMGLDESWTDSDGKMRRPSIMRSNNSNSLAALQRKMRQFEPTYKMEPDEKPDVKSIKLILTETLQARFKDVSYESFQKSPTMNLARTNNEIHRKVKVMCPPRYRYIIELCCLENANQEFSMSSSFLWNKKLDSFTVAEFKNTSLIAVAVCHLIYTE